jgi:hypothetical protein
MHNIPKHINIDFPQRNEVCDAAASQIRVSAMLLLLMIGNWNYGFSVAFKSMMPYNVTVGQLADTHKQYGNISSTVISFLGKKHKKYRF